MNVTFRSRVRVSAGTLVSGQGSHRFRFSIRFRVNVGVRGRVMVYKS